MTEEGRPSLRQSFGEVLVRLAGERPGLLVVLGPDAGLVEWFAQVWPERLVTVPQAMTRLSVGQGISRAGGESVVVLDELVTTLAVPLVAPTVLLTADVAHLALAHRAGVTACQPGWAADIPALLVGALGAGEPVLLHLPEPIEDLPAVRQPDRTTFGDPRTLHRGRQGLVVGAGRTAPLAALVAERLAREQVDVLALDSHTIGPASGLDAALTTDHLLVGPVTAPRAGALEPVAVDPTDLPGTTARVRAALDRARAAASARR